MRKIVLSSIAAASAIACVTSVQASDIILQDQTILGYQFSAMRLVPSLPALDCVVTGPADVSATLHIVVFLFDDKNAPTPYARIAGKAVLEAGRRGLCDLNNGQQVIPPKQPKKIELQVTTSSEVRHKTIAVPVP